jgi:hypothetical protein
MKSYRYKRKNRKIKTIKPYSYIGLVPFGLVLLVALLAIYGSSICWPEGDLSFSTTL